MIEELLAARLKLTAEKVYPVKAPEDAEAPLVVYQRVGTTRETHLSGPSGIAYATFRIDTYHMSYSETATLADALRLSCNGWKEGSVLYCKIESDIDFGAEPDEDGYFRRSFQADITHVEA